MSQTERRRFRRFQVLDGFAEAVTIKFGPETAKDGAVVKHSKKDLEPQQPGSQPALMTDLSAGGMSLILFSEPAKVRKLSMTLDLPGISRASFEGKIVRIIQKGETYSVAVAFTKVAPKTSAHISRMADDNADCETRLSLRVPEVCTPSCAFHALCAKSQKGPYWRSEK